MKACLYYTRFGLLSLFDGISTFVGYSMLKSSFLEEQYWYYLTHKLFLPLAKIIVGK